MKENGSTLERWARGVTSPFVTALDRLGLTPTGVTVIGFLLNVLAAAIIWRGNLGIGALAFLFASWVDMMDGALARRLGQESKLGAFLDSTLDRLSETAILVAVLHDVLTFAYGPPWIAEMTLLALAGSLTVSYVRARAEALGSECKVGWMERPERVVLLAIGMLAGRTWLAYVIFALAILSWVTVIQRIVHVRGRFLREERS